MKKIFFTLLAAMSLSSLLAVPAYRRLVKVQQEDGTMIEAILNGDEYNQFYTDPISGEILMSISAGNEAGPMRRSEQPRRLSSPTPHLGENYYPVLLVQFSDKSFSDIYKTGDADFQYASPLAMFEDYFNGENYTYMQSNGSFAKYFADQSFGKYIPKFDLIGVVTLSKSYADYNGGSGNNALSTQQAIRDAINLAYSKGLITTEMLGRWDNNCDGLVDAIHVLFAGFSRSYGESSSIIWPHNSQLGRLELDSSAPAFNSYVCSTEMLGLTTDSPMVDGIGVAVHEFGHVLGLPDFYDVNKNKGETAVYGMDEYSVMDQGCYNHGSRYPTSYTAHERMYLDWMEADTLPYTLTDSTTVTLPLLCDSAKAFIYRNPNNPNEAFLFENHGKSGWDTFFGNVSYSYVRGMLITHVEYDEAAWNSNKVNTNYTHPHFAPVPADGELLAYNFSCYKATRNDSTAMDIVEYRVSAFNDLWPCSEACRYIYKLTATDGVAYKKQLGGPYTEFSATTTPKAVFFDGTEADFIIENIAEDFNTNLITFSIKGKDYKGEEPPTAISEINVTTESPRMEMHDGHIIIYRGEKRYHLNGQKL